MASELDPRDPVEPGERAFTVGGEMTGNTTVQALVVSAEEGKTPTIHIPDDLMLVNSYFDVERRSWHTLLVSRTAMHNSQIRVKRMIPGN